MIPFIGCPHCHSLRFVAGPRGGSSQNVICMGCSAGYNLLIPPLPGPFLLLEQIRPPTGQPADTAGAVYIIELIEHIDTSDIPEADEDWFRRARLR